jgi:hypothetical protein
MPIVKKSGSSSKKVVNASSSPIDTVVSTTIDKKVISISLSSNIIKSKPATEVVLDVTDLGPLAQIAATDVNTLINGTYLVFDSVSGQFISTSQIGAATTSIAGFPITTTNPHDNAILGFSTESRKWIYQDPFSVVDLSDGEEDGHQDFGAF